MGLNRFLAARQTNICYRSGQIQTMRKAKAVFNPVGSLLLPDRRMRFTLVH